MGGKTKQIKTSLYLEAETFEKLKAISERTMIPMARLLRKAAGYVIKEYSR